MQRHDLREHLPPHVRRKPCSDLAGESQILSVVVAYEKRIHTTRARSVSADNELLLPIELQLDPRGVALAGRGPGGLPFRNHAFQAKTLDGLDHLLGVPGNSIDKSTPESFNTSGSLARRSCSVAPVIPSREVEDVECVEDDRVTRMGGSMLERLK